MMRNAGDRVALASVGQVFQLDNVSRADSMPRPYQLCCKPLLQQQRHQRAGCGDAEADARKNHAADNAAPGRRGMRQD